MTDSEAIAAGHNDDLLGDKRLKSKKKGPRPDAAAISRANMAAAISGEGSVAASSREGNDMWAPPEAQKEKSASSSSPEAQAAEKPFDKTSSSADPASKSTTKPAKPSTAAKVKQSTAPPGHVDPTVLDDPRLADDLLTLKLLAASKASHPELDAKLKELGFGKLGMRLRIREALVAMQEEHLVPLKPLEITTAAGPQKPEPPKPTTFTDGPDSMAAEKPPRTMPAHQVEEWWAKKAEALNRKPDGPVDWSKSDFYLEVEALAANMPRREPAPPPQYKWWIVKAERVAVRPGPGREGAPLSAFRKGAVLRIQKVEEHIDHLGSAPWARLADSEIPFLYCTRKVREAWVLVAHPTLGDLIEPVPLEALDTGPYSKPEEKEKLEKDLFDPTMGPNERSAVAAKKASELLEKVQAEAKAEAEAKAAQEKDDSIMAQKDWQAYFGQGPPPSTREEVVEEPEPPKYPPLRPYKKPPTDILGQPIQPSSDESDAESDPGMDEDVDTPGGSRASALAKAHRKAMARGGHGSGGGGAPVEHEIRQKGARTKDEQFENDAAKSRSKKKDRDDARDNVSMPTTISVPTTTYARPAGPPKPPQMPMLPPRPTGMMQPVEPEPPKPLPSTRPGGMPPQPARPPGHTAPHIPIMLTPQQEEARRFQTLEEARRQLREMASKDDSPLPNLKEVKF